MSTSFKQNSSNLCHSVNILFMPCLCDIDRDLSENANQQSLVTSAYSVKIFLIILSAVVFSAFDSERNCINLRALLDNEPLISVSIRNEGDREF